MSTKEPDLLDRLIAIRKWRGLTQGQVAERMFVARSMRSLIENRSRGARVGLLEAYAKAVGAEIGAWPVPFAEPGEAKRPPAGVMQVPVPAPAREVSDDEWAIRNTVC